jgi:hypothetical protein
MVIIQQGIMSKTSILYFIFSLFVFKKKRNLDILDIGGSYCNGYVYFTNPKFFDPTPMQSKSGLTIGRCGWIFQIDVGWHISNRFFDFFFVVFSSIPSSSSSSFRIRKGSIIFSARISIRLKEFQKIIRCVLAILLEMRMILVS